MEDFDDFEDFDDVLKKKTGFNQGCRGSFHSNLAGPPCRKSQEPIKSLELILIFIKTNLITLFRS